VKIKNQSNGMEMNYKLVAESEADLKTGKISVTSYRENYLVEGR
jgi:transcription elongation factor GreA